MRLQIGHLKSIQQTNGIGRKLGPRVDEERRQWKSSQQGKVPPVWTLGCCITWWGSHGMPRWGNVMTWSWHVTTFQKASTAATVCGQGKNYRETQRVMCLFMVHFLDRRFLYRCKIHVGYGTVCAVHVVLPFLDKHFLRLQTFTTQELTPASKS